MERDKDGWINAKVYKPPYAEYPKRYLVILISNARSNHAEDFVDFKNKQNAFSPTATKDSNGISKAWLMGDGKYWYEESEIAECDLDSLFDWERDDV